MTDEFETDINWAVDGIDNQGVTSHQLIRLATEDGPDDEADDEEPDDSAPQAPTAEVAEETAVEPEPAPAAEPEAGAQ